MRSQFLQVVSQLFPVTFCLNISNCPGTDYSSLSVTNLSIRGSSSTGHNMAALRVTTPCTYVSLLVRVGEGCEMWPAVTANSGLRCWVRRGVGLIECSVPRIVLGPLFCAQFFASFRDVVRTMESRNCPRHIADAGEKGDAYRDLV